MAMAGEKMRKNEKNRKTKSLKNGFRCRLCRKTDNITKTECCNQFIYEAER